MDLTANVARTAHDQKNVNKLRVPEFGVLQVRLEAGGKLSKSYTVRGAPAAKAANTGTDDFHFAPGPQLDAATWAVAPSRTDKVKITYELHNPFLAIEKATLELFRRFSAAPVWTRQLKDDELLHGQHTLKFGDETEWDGNVGAHDAFPDQFLTVEHSPYKLKLTVEGKNGICVSPAAWTYLHVLIAKLELEYGPDEVVAEPDEGEGDDRAVFAALKAQGASPPVKDTKVKVYLTSNKFKKGHSMADNSLYTVYEGLWGDGPEIPLFAKVHTKSSADQPVLAPKSLGKVRFLWDWESESSGTPTEFVQRAQDYDVQATKPTGQNNHTARGGKRGPGAVAVFPAQAGYAPADTLQPGEFPFKVEACPAPRVWSAYSYAWTDKKLAAKTGVFFQPSRMAGDAYSITVHVAHDVNQAGNVKLNVDSDAPLPLDASLKASTGTFEVWRKLHFRKYLKKTAGATTLNLASIANCYTRAFVEIENAAGAAQVMDEATWNNAFKAAMSEEAVLVKLLVDPSVNQHAAGPAGAYFRTRAELMQAWRKLVITHALTAAGVPAARAERIATAAAGQSRASDAHAQAGAAASMAGYGPEDSSRIAGIASTGWAFVGNSMNNPANGLDTEAKYAAALQKLALKILKEVFDAQLPDGDGVTIFQTERPHNQTHRLHAVSFGLALDFPSGTEDKCGFLLMGWAGCVRCGLDKLSAHEIGHHLFLPHPPDTWERRDYKAHDKDVNSCLMSYNENTAMELCGFCQLRLRGWDKSALDPDGTRNQRG
ncbi:MAG TPA: hypothetical protein VNE39_19795 [Planctomycetota bacterium]|nr:hypothetical protein [Planctomycetota bacterium]